MKHLVLVLVFMLLASQLIAQQDRSTYEAKLARYTKMKKNGTGLAIAGGILTLAGIVMVSSADYHLVQNSYGSSSLQSDDPKAAAGAISILGGLGMAGAGIPLAIIGSKKSRQYSEKLKTLSLNMRVAPQRAAIGLTLRF